MSADNQGIATEFVAKTCSVLAVSLVLLAMVGGIVGTTTGLIWAIDARRDADFATAIEAAARKQTRQGLKLMTDAAIEDLLGRQVELTDQHREFLKKVLAQHVEFAAAKAGDPEGDEGRAEGYYQVARIRHLLGESKQAVADFEVCLALREKLVADSDQQADRVSELASTHRALGACALGNLRPRSVRAHSI